MNIIKPSAYMKLKPSSESFLETECLFGETVKILDSHLGWVYCELMTDNYRGWVQKTNIGKMEQPTHRVINIRTFIFKNADIKSEILLYLPMGANLAVKNINSDWAEICFPIDNIMTVGFVPTKHIVELKHRFTDWVQIAQNLEGIPYVWGGRDTVGVDCSALLQLAYQAYGETIPRNTSHQVLIKKKNVYQIEHLNRGCVIFWKGHVGIMIDKLNCIHANAFHMKTITEPLINIINRIDKDNQIVKMMDFN